MFKFIIKQLDKIPDSSGLLKGGVWRVHYADIDEYSLKMTYDAAQSYASIFDGKVIWVRYDDPTIKVVNHENT